MPKAAGKDKEMDGVEKAAILLIALGPEKSAQIFKHLKENRTAYAGNCKHQQRITTDQGNGTE